MSMYNILISCHLHPPPSPSTKSRVRHCYPRDTGPHLLCQLFYEYKVILIPVSRGGGGNDFKTFFHFPLGIMLKRMISPQKFLIILNEIQ